MIWMILIFCILSLTIGSCGTLSTEQGSETEHSLPTLSATENPTNTPSHTSTPHTPSATPTTMRTVTPTDILQPTATYQPSETHNLPTLTARQPLTITHISMINTRNGWAIGHQTRSGDRILYTQDGGYTWEERTPPIEESSEQNDDLFKVWGYFYDEQTAWVIYLAQNQPPPVSAPVVWRTSDSGQSWGISDPLPLTGAEFYFIPENFSFIDPLQGWLLVHVDAGMSHDYSNLYITSDGGITWQRLIDPFGDGLQSLHHTGLAFADSKFGWVTKDNLAVMPGTFLEQTLDGGQTWEDNFLPAPSTLDWFSEISQCATSYPTFLESDRGIVLVNCQTFEEHIFTYTYISPDQGQSWQSVQLPTTVQSLFFINNNSGWALGRDLYQSTDGGLSWVKIKTVNWDGQFSFVDEKTGWAVALNGEEIALVFTQDGGHNWQLIQPAIE